MLESYNFRNAGFTDLNVYQCGIEDCQSSYSYGPAVRDHYLLHYILEGQGTYYVGNRTYTLSKGQGFLIWPNVVTLYQADSSTPWSYAWVGFNGLKAEHFLKSANLSQSNLIFVYSEIDFIKNCFIQMNKTNSLGKGRDARLHGYLYVLLSQLMEESANSPLDEQDTTIQELYVKKSIEYIMHNYYRKITVEDISEYIGISRSYLFSLFKNKLNLSPQEYIIKFKMQKAVDLIRNEALSIGDIARSVGYEDCLVFSKAFRKSLGCSPSKFRKEL